MDYVKHRQTRSAAAVRLVEKKVAQHLVRHIEAVVGEAVAIALMNEKPLRRIAVEYRPINRVDIDLEAARELNLRDTGSPSQP